MERQDVDSGIRLADLVATLSLATDLGLGQPMEHVLRSWLIASRLGARLGLDDVERGRCTTSRCWPGSAVWPTRRR